MKYLLTALVSIVCSEICISQAYTPLPVSGFNHDVIAEGNGTYSAVYLR